MNFCRLRYGNSNPSISEITVSKIQTCYLMNEYLSQLSGTPIRTLEDIVTYNNQNRGSEGGHPHDIPAFPDGQILFEECVRTKGIKTEEYHAALKHITSQCRENGIDAALKYRVHSDAPASLFANHNERGEIRELDALLFCDVKRGGIQIAAQAGYPVVTIPVSLDPDGMPVSLVLIHSKWQDDKLVKWASAIEDLFGRINHAASTRASATKGRGEKASNDLPRRKRMGRIPPVYMDHLRKNIPVDPAYRYEGAKGLSGGSLAGGDGDSDKARSAGSGNVDDDSDEMEDWERPTYFA